MKYFCTILLVLLLAGCGRNVPLTGQVVFSDDGTPLDRGYVGFVQPSFMARGVIDKDGRYVVGSYRDRDGLPPGTYKITVHCTVDEENTEGVSLIDPKYNDPERSGLLVEVEKSTKTYDIQVDRAR